MATSTPASITPEETAGEVRGQNRLPRALKSPRLVASALVIIVVVGVGLLAPVIAPGDPLAINPTHVLQPASPGHLLGTDEFGRDIFTRLLYGARPSLIIAACATLLAMCLGMLMGVVAGYWRGWVEQGLMRTVDTLLCFPPIVLAMVVVGFLGGGLINLIVVIGILYAPTFARLAYAATIQIKEMEYVTAAISLGAGHGRVILRHVVPNVLSPMIVQASLTAASAILLESGLSFLGLGVQPPAPSWGLMIGAARGYMFQAPAYLVWPSLVIAGTILAINTFGDALRDLLDPRLRGR